MKVRFKNKKHRYRWFALSFIALIGLNGVGFLWPSNAKNIVGEKFILYYGYAALFLSAIALTWFGLENIQKMQRDQERFPRESADD